MVYLEESEVETVKKALFRSGMLVNLANDYSYHKKAEAEAILAYIDKAYEQFIKEQENERSKEDVQVF